MREIIRKFTCGHPSHMWRPVTWLFLESICMSVPAVAVYFVINAVVSAFNSPESLDYQELWRLAAVMGGMMVLQLLVSTGAFLNTFLPGTIHSAENKTDFVKKLRNLPLGYFLKKESGELINTFTGDFLAVEQSMVGLFTGIFSVVFSCLLTSVVLFLFQPEMALALYICIPVAALVIALSMNLTVRLTKRNIAARDTTATYLNEYLIGMKTLKSYNQTGAEFSKLREAYQHLMKVNIQGESISGALLNLANIFVKLGLPLMCFAGAWLIMRDRLTIIEYLGLIVIGTKVISPVLTWVRYMVMLRTHYVSAGRIDDIMQYPAMSGTGQVDASADICFEDVVFTYEEAAETPVLDHISLRIPAGKLTAVVGPSGGGKSTILRLIARFWDPQAGQVKCGSSSLKECDPEEWLGNVSMVLQEVYLFHETVRENILFGRKDANEEELMEAARKAGCHDFIMKLPQGYDTVVGEGGNTLSGGEKQRISIARAILKDAPILLLDEPTASLDARNEVLIQQAIGELVKGRTVVMIAHRLKTVENADQILVLDQGRIKECGTHRELVGNKGMYQRLWQLQNEALDWNI